MKTKLFALLFYIILFPFVVQAQGYECVAELSNDSSSLLRSSRIGSAKAFYDNLNNWIPYGILAPNEPLKNPPLMVIDIAFHIFLDDSGGNNAYTPSETGSLIWAFNLLNEIHAGFDEHEHNHGKGTSNPVPGLVELPDCDTRIRFSLGNNNERIYF